MIKRFAPLALAAGLLIGAPAQMSLRTLLLPGKSALSLLRAAWIPAWLEAHSIERPGDLRDAVASPKNTVNPMIFGGYSRIALPPHLNPVSGD